MKLEQSKMFELLNRFPNVNLSYESAVSANNVTQKYDIYLEIPKAKKYFAWFTYYDDSNVCFLLELNKEKMIISANISPNVIFDKTLSIGTVLYGSLIENNSIDPKFSKQSFIVEDVLMFKGISLSAVLLIEKINYIVEILNLLNRSPLLFFIASIKKINPAPIAVNCETPETPQPIVSLYPIHHYQYRSLTQKCPYLNSKNAEPLNASTAELISTATKPEKCLSFTVSPTVKNYSNSQYKLKTTFLILSESICDIYSLYAMDKQNKFAFYDYAYIPNLKSSIYMNSHFRKIKENRNIDYIEESDDEDDFQNTDCNKHVDLQKKLVFECVFHNKFKRWIPIKLIEDSNRMNRVIQLKKLVV